MRRPLTLAAIITLLALSGCALLPGVPPLPELPTEAVAAGPLAVGSCLDARIAADSDRDALVECEEPHLYEVTSIEIWPGMEATLAGEEPGAVWDTMHIIDAGAGNEEYQQWAVRTCNAAAQDIIGISDVEVDGLTALDLGLQVGGTHGVDLSLASREAFVAGDHRTVCSLFWYDDLRNPRSVSGPGFAQLLHPGFGLDRRECWSRDSSVIACDLPHASQVLLSFNGLVPFGPDVIERAATGHATDEDWRAASAFCEELLLQTLPFSADFGDLGFLADIERGHAWDVFDGTVNPKGSYFYVCLAVGRESDDLITGDVLDGTALIDTSGDGA